jgi:hypothetical protein
LSRQSAAAYIFSIIFAESRLAGIFQVVNLWRK